MRGEALSRPYSLQSSFDGAIPSRQAHCAATDLPSGLLTPLCQAPATCRRESHSSRNLSDSKEDTDSGIFAKRAIDDAKCLKQILLWVCRVQRKKQGRKHAAWGNEDVGIILMAISMGPLSPGRTRSAEVWRVPDPLRRHYRSEGCPELFRSL